MPLVTEYRVSRAMPIATASPWRNACWVSVSSLCAAQCPKSSGRALPVYRTVATEGPAHRRTFTVSVTVVGLPPATASGSSKRVAEAAAAAAALAVLGTGA